MDYSSNKKKIYPNMWHLPRIQILFGIDQKCDRDSLVIFELLMGLGKFKLSENNCTNESNVSLNVNVIEMILSIDTISYSCLCLLWCIFIIKFEWSSYLLIYYFKVAVLRGKKSGLGGNWSCLVDYRPVREMVINYANCKSSISVLLVVKFSVLLEEFSSFFVGV